MRGSRDEYGSWKTICICLRMWVMFFAVTGSPSKMTSPAVGS